MKFDTHPLDNTFAEIDAALAHNPDAIKFLAAFNVYCNKIDDIIDEAARREDPRFVLGSFLMAAEVYSSRYFQLNCGLLYGVVASLAHIYTAAVKFERDDREEMQQLGRTLSLIQVSLIIAVLHIECGWDKTAELSEKLIQYAYVRQKNYAIEN